MRPKSTSTRSITQYTQRGFEFAQRMWVASGRNSTAVEFARFVQTAHLLERLATVIIGRRIRRIGRQHGFEFRNRARPFPSVDVFHGQSVTSEFARRVPRQDFFEELNARGHYLLGYR